MNSKLAITQEATVININDWVGRLAVIREKMQAKGDENNARKILQLVEKVKHNEFSIGFCGHFSAGKSSMINELWEEDLLPSSPIPTSANLVKVKAGEPWARIYFKQQQPIQFSYPYDINKVKKYCVDGDEVESVEISHPSIHFPENVVIMDTPGIDSTDDAHRVATASSLHLADIVFYVMDYNHVQSELNFHFAKEIKEQGKKVYFVINQIDKHHSEEISFADFRQGVDDAFQNWNIQPDGVFYTSLQNKEHVHNEFQQLKQFIHSLIEQKDEAFHENLWNATVSVINEHYHWLKSLNESKKEELHKQISTLSNIEISKIKEEYEEASQKKKNNETKLHQFEDELKNELAKILNNAILMPFETRDLAKSFLESKQANFKVGMFFSKKKTEEERDRRLQAFYTNFMEKVSAQLDWHIKQLLVNKAKDYGIEDGNGLFTSIYNEEIEIQQTLLNELVKPGASVNGDYILKYTEDVAEEVKKAFKQFGLRVLDRLMERLQFHLDQENQKLEQQIGETSKIINAFQAKNHLEKEEQSNKTALLAILNEEHFAEQSEIEKAIKNLPNEKQVSIANSDDLYEGENKSQEVDFDGPPVEQQNDKQDEVENSREAILHTVHKLKAVSKEIKGLSGFKTTAKEMIERANRLENKQYTVALFGAFSAGKSSFANALIGDHVLPVSPNPTTATINKILPVNDEHPHGTVVVKMKPEKLLLEDIQSSLKYFNKQVDTIHGTRETIDTIKADELSPKEKPHFSFLQAVRRGIDFYRNHAGSEMTISLKEFEQFVADEEKACFVEWIELYYDCPLTQEGITLVDTPGADSVNARHTGVAFEYIKNADAILFVTYYNHAFSHADKEFLIQLGRVKDIFELDKMFFIVNAADLAKSNDELEMVLEHVNGNLLQYGIRHPRIFPVSSQMALLSKIGQKRKLSTEQETRLMGMMKATSGNVTDLSEKGYVQSKIEAFERSFHLFTSKELTAAAVDAANTEISRTVETLKEWIESAQLSSEKREEKRRQSEQLRNDLINEVRSIELASDKRALLQEIEELFYYVKQRLFLRYNEMFQQAFNPAVLQNDKQPVKEKLKGCLQELVDFIGFDLAQEVRATSLRIEAFLSKQIKSTFNQAEKSIHERSSSSFLHNFEMDSIELPQFHEPFDTVNVPALYPILAKFKNTKHFFELDGKKEMREAIETAFQSPVEDYLSVNRKQLSAYYDEIFNEETEKLKRRLEREINDYFDGQLSALAPNVDIQELQSLCNKIMEV
ncbi:hypothetical protein DCC39_02180 [Pueribacillus theae]|uniref:Dynamin N-terminal domain-containing protein n=1 Tax=Pueribacillus theae TaxID=2171751 RepID=A0A2U1K7S6_9BACI|nr:dynamin family protein [Pueribacillus theae]PWA13274.1 hypothetical protein DCC39_02180 [Pueribacillus theae]